MSTVQPVPVRVYVLSGCIHCTRALALLRRRGIEHEIVSGDAISGFRLRLLELTGGSTVPQIVIDRRPVGGADRLARLDRRGVLAALAHGQPLPVTRVRRRRLRTPSARWLAEAFDAGGRHVQRWHRCLGRAGGVAVRRRG